MKDIITVQADRDAEYIPGSSASNVFHAYDIRGVYPYELSDETAYKAAVAFHNLLGGRKYVVAYDMRESSDNLFKAITQAIVDSGAEVDSLGMCTTDNLYYAVGKYGYDGGVMITASHNSAQFNGLKFVGQDATPILMSDLKTVFDKIELQTQYIAKDTKPTRYRETSTDFLNHVWQFAHNGTRTKIKIVVDAGNGLAGDTVRRFCNHYPEIELIPMYFEPHADFPHHEANPAIASNLVNLQQRVLAEGADFGAAFDGDGDRVFFIDHKGQYIEGYYIQALLSEYFLLHNPGESVVYDLRNTRAIKSIARITNGQAVLSKAGHSFVKKSMREANAIFGGESTSSHFYYRDNYFADSGIITLATVLKIIWETGHNLFELVKIYRQNYPVSGERNFYLADKGKFAEIGQRLRSTFADGEVNELDGFVMEFNNWRFSLRVSNTEPFIRLNIEARDTSILEENQALVFKVVEEYAKYTGNVGNVYSIHTVNLSNQQKLEYLFSNLQFSWNSNKGNYLDDLYKSEWGRNQSPLDIVRQIDRPLLNGFYEQNRRNIEESTRLHQTYLRANTWFDTLAMRDPLLAKLKSNPIAYFSLEFGLVDWLQLYAGGLGILAGDTIKQASDSGLPMVGLGLLYAQGYFYQRFTQDGWQVEDYLSQDSDDYPLETVKDEHGLTIVIDVNLGDHVVKVRAWRLKVGRRSLLLLDTNFNDNLDPLDRMITYHLYGGDEDTRIKQELVLAFAGYQLLQKLGIKPSILHLNEGHSAFAILAQAMELMRQGRDFNSAINTSKRNILFTNHTLKQAGNDLFSKELVKRYLDSYAREMGVDFEQIYALGVDSKYSENFGMTILGLNNAAKVNAVSQIHAKAALDVWPDHPMVPVTNGVHLPTWVSQSMHELFDEYISERWTNTDPRDLNWEKIDQIPSDKLWLAHMQSKRELISMIKRNLKITLEEDSLIFGWFRRVTAYKQPDILLLDLERLERLVNGEKPVYFIFGGKAHPKDSHGKEILKQLFQMTKDSRFAGKLILIPDYNWRMAKFLVAGSDVWLNSPVRFQEACGTSGMKAAANGCLQFSTMDGWIDEVPKSIVWEIADSLNAEQYFSRIEREIYPLFWQRDNGIPQAWVERMKSTLKVVLPKYGANRMLCDYIDKLYRPILENI